MDPRVSQLLARLGGLYRDPTRVDRDASSLLRSSVGQHLKPIIDKLFDNDGTSHQTLCLQGTVAIHFRGNTYQQLVDIYLPEGYPVRPPTCYVRLAPNMYIKEAHAHVGSDGQVYLPYLHEWRQQSHNLVEMVVAMSSTFSADPPVFSRQAPPPPDYSTAFRTSATTATSNGAAAAAAADKAAKALRDAEEEARLEAASLEASKREEEQRLQKERSMQEQWDAKNFASVKDRVRRKVALHLTDVAKTTKTALQTDVQDQQRLQQSAERLQSQQKDLALAKRNLELALKQVDVATVGVTEWLQQRMSDQDEKEISIDDLVTTESTVHQQMLDLAAENHSLTDAMYYLDQALHQATMDMPVYLKEIRSLAKKQFLVKAHLIKISQTLGLNSVGTF
jgi:ESCRT-I complex subunit TSG101